MTREEQIRQHYLLEKELAQRILASSRQERTRVAIQAYNELFGKISWHPQLCATAKTRRKRLDEKCLVFGHWVGSRTNILDIGSGSADWIRFLAIHSAGRCVGIDVSEQILVGQVDDPPNLELKIMDAVELNFQANSFDVVFSSQLIEHLHPDDVELHLAKVHQVLQLNGVYVFDTPSRLTGPHDVSKYFDKVATGFHLKEWTYYELADLLKQVGFSRIRTMIFPWSVIRRLPFLQPWGMVPTSWVTPGERLVAKIASKKARCQLAKIFRVSSIYIVAQK